MLMAIGGYFIGVYLWLLMVIREYSIGVYL
jgi:hypothetical protein